MPSVDGRKIVSWVPVLFVWIKSELKYRIQSFVYQILYLFDSRSIERILGNDGVSVHSTLENLLDLIIIVFSIA